MTTQNGRAFNEWLRAQLKAKKMSQRQLAQQSGVDHSTISRLIRGDRMPSLGTATKLARGLRELRDDADTAAVPGPRGLRRDQPDRPRRVRAARRRAPHRGAGPPDHGVLPRRADAPIRAFIRPGLGPTGRWRANANRPADGASGAAARPVDEPDGGSSVRSVSARCRHGPSGGGGRAIGSPPLLVSISQARPGSPSTVRVSGTANAGVWGAGVRRCGPGTRDALRPTAAGRTRTRTARSRLEPVQGTSPRRPPHQAAVTLASAGPPGLRLRLARRIGPWRRRTRPANWSTVVSSTPPGANRSVVSATKARPRRAGHRLGGLEVRQ